MKRVPAEKLKESRARTRRANVCVSDSVYERLQAFNTENYSLAGFIYLLALQQLDILESQQSNVIGVANGYRGETKTFTN